ncbi:MULTISPECIES: hypothetical protein [unclassified Thioalkalivibrio]|uniref:hypothetical protein n=1 Tax=unclassified Thioalkalivibrio TaxID=2621013 RepID=UPI000399BDD7|nr:MULTISPECIES: hypothetical protein [unclassified Thioalkalivibrio]
MSKPSREYMGRVSEVPCVLCECLGMPGVPAEVHHLREGQGASQRASDYLTAALCPECHRGPMGVHGDRALLRMAKLEELDLLALTIERVMKR